MAEVIKMPLMSDTMEEGVIAEWHVKVGDKVSSGDLLAEIETDKATIEFESFWDGTMLDIGVESGATVPVGAILAVIGEEGEDYKAALEAARTEAPAAVAGSSGEKQPSPAKEEAATPPQESSSTPAPQDVPPEATQFVSPQGNGRVKASPLAKIMAQEKGIDLNTVNGTGDDGRIIKRDIEAFEKAGPVAAGVPLAGSVGTEGYHETRVSQMRKAIAKRLSESKFSAPHFYLTMEVNMDQAISARKSMNEVSPVKISFNDMIIKAAATAIRQHPDINASWMGDQFRYYDHIHVGMAVAIDEGLIVPVVKFADTKTLSQISAESSELATKARDKKLQPEEFTGNTFTVSNLGMFDIDEFTAIINPPEACILAVGRIKETPVVSDGEMIISSIMKMTLSCDHRVVDGAMGARFLQTLKGLLEDPVRMLV